MKSGRDAPTGREARAIPPERSPKRSYEPPRLEVLGDVRDVTLGATIGLGDSTPLNSQN